MFKLKPDKCTNCRLCELACVWTHESLNGVSMARLRISDHWPDHPAIAICLACKGRNCVQACPEDALRWDNWIVLDVEKCNGCQSCVQACPMDGVHWDHATDQPLICDTCSGQYSCVKWCPTGAIPWAGATGALLADIAKKYWQ